MARKIYKEIKQSNGKITFYGANRFQNLYYAKPEWSTDKDDVQEYFIHRGRRYYLSEFMCIGAHAPDYMKEFDGYTNDSFFSGLVIKLAEDCEQVKVFLFIS